MDRTFHIELAKYKDAKSIAAISKADIEYCLPLWWTPSRVCDAIADSNTNVAVVRQRGSLVAFGIMSYDDEIAHLQLLAVRWTLRRKGVGSALLVWLEQVARVAGISQLLLEARKENIPALAFYHKHGYRDIETVVGMYSGVDDGVRLEKVISRTGW